MHHTNHGACSRCIVKASEVHPALKEIWDLVRVQFPDCHIAWAFRNEEEQNQCFKSGASRLKWPKSKHNLMKNGIPCAEAIDLFQLDEEGVARFEVKYYAEIYYFLIRELMPIEWAGKWSRMKESTHFELAGEE